MPRPRKCRTINRMPTVTYFKPRGIPMRNLTEVFLPIEGLEALRLADWEGLTHEKAAEKMGISRQTFGRILAQAHRIVAETLISGYALCIQGGDYVLAGEGSKSAIKRENTEHTGPQGAKRCLAPFDSGPSKLK